MKKLTLILSFLAGISTIKVAAQQEMMLSHITESWQFNSISPSFFPEGKRVAIGLPALGLDAFHSGSLSYNDFFRKENGNNLIDLDQAIGQLEDENTIVYRQRIETASLGIRLPGKGKTALSLSHAIRINSNTTYQRELVQLLWQGNAQFIGQTIEVAPTTNTYNWHEVDLGISRKFGPVRVGAKARYLMGVSALNTDANARSLSVYTNPDIYQLQLTSNYGFYSAGLVSSIDTSGLGFDVTVDDLTSKINKGSNGFAFDLGVSTHIGDKIMLYASALDLGASIHWTETKYFKSNGTFAFDGATIPGADLINGSDSLDFSTQLDTLNDIFQFQQSTAADFSTTLPARYYAGGTFQVTKRVKLGASVYHESYKEANQTAFGLSVQLKPVKWFEFGAIYTANRNKAANIGLQIGLHPGPVHFFLASDQVPGLLKPRGSSSVNLRTGMSVVF